MKELYNECERLAIALFILFLVIIFAFNFLRVQKEKQEVINNYKALEQELVKYRLADSSQVAEITTLQIDKSTLEEVFSKQAEEIKQLNIRLKDAKSYSKTATETIVTINDTIRDSILIVNNVVDTLQCVSYADKYLDMFACIKNNKMQGQVKVYDSLTIVNSVEKKKFWFIRYGVKRVKTSVRTSNPYTEIKSIESITIK